MARVLIAGCGFVGGATARLLQSAGWDVTGITRSEESAARLVPQGLRVFPCDISDAAQMKKIAFEGADAVVHCASSAGGGAEEYRKIYLDGARNLLEILHPQKFLFTSSTSVYAQTGGEWVAEESPAEPSGDTGKILRETEDLVLARGGIVARLAGIYGPGRWALLRKFLDGTAVIEGDGSRWLNHIHRDDAASAIVKLLNNRSATGIYNVSDSTPLTQLDCLALLAEKYGKPLPPHGTPGIPRKRGITSKRVSNEKLRTLGWIPQFPSIREALAGGGFPA